MIVIPCVGSLLCTISLGWLCWTQLQTVERNRSNSDITNSVAEIYLSLAEYSYNALRCAFQHTDGDETTRHFSQQMDKQLLKLTDKLKAKGVVAENQTKTIVESMRALKKEVDEIKEFVQFEQFDNNISRMSAIAPAVSHGQLLSLDVEKYLAELKLSQEKDQHATDNRVQQIFEISIATLLVSSLTVCSICLLFELTVSRRLEAIWRNQMLLKELKEPEASTTQAKDELDYVNQVLCETAMKLIQVMNETKQLIQMIAHDLRSPLMSVQVLIVMFSEKHADILSESELLLCDRLETLLVDISEVVTNLLVFDSLKSGHCELKITNNDLYEIIQQAIAKNRKIAFNRGIKLENRCTIAALYSDKELTSRIMSLCLKRAIETAPEDSTIVLKSDADASFTSLLITEECSDERVRTHLTSTIHGDFTKDALYLSLSQLVVQAHGGHVEFNSNPYATYQFFFPKIQKPKPTIFQTLEPSKSKSFWTEISFACRTSLGKACIIMSVLPLLIQVTGYLLMSSQVYAAQLLEQETFYCDNIISILNTTWIKTYEGNSALAFYILLDDVADKREAIAKYEALAELFKSAAKNLEKSSSNYSLWSQTEVFIDNEVALFRNYLATPKLSSRTEALGTLPTVLERAEQVHTKLQKLISNESQLLFEKQRKLSAEWRFVQNSLTIFTICNFLVLGALALRFRKLTWRKLNAVIETAQLLGNGQKLQNPLGQADELGELDRALHAISDELDRTRAENKSITIMLKDEVEGPLQRGLSELQGLAQLSRTDSRLSRSWDDLERAIVGTQRLISLVDELFGLAAGGDPRLVIIKRLNRLDHFVNEIGQSMKVLAAKKQIQLEFDAPAQTACFDSGRMGQVLTNLINNAIKFSPSQSTIKLECSFNGSILRFDVIDEGPGIRNADLLRVFDKHFKSDKQKTGSAFGLGLTLCKSTVEACSGTIEARNNPTVGATFTVEIPIDPS